METGVSFWFLPLDSFHSGHDRQHLRGLQKDFFFYPLRRPFSVGTKHQTYVFFFSSAGDNFSRSGSYRSIFTCDVVFLIEECSHPLCRWNRQWPANALERTSHNEITRTRLQRNNKRKNSCIHARLMKHGYSFILLSFSSPFLKFPF